MSGLLGKIIKSKAKDKEITQAIRATTSVAALGITLPDSTLGASIKATSHTPSNSSTSDAKKIPGRKKQECLEWGVTALDFLKEISESNELLSPLKAACGATKAILETIKAMDSNTEGWKGILETVRRHHETFEEQLRLMNADDISADAASALLSPIKAYAKELEGILKELMSEIGISEENVPAESKFQSLKTFMLKYGTVKLEADRISEYGGRLDDAMKQFNTSMTVYMSFKLHSVDQKLDKIDAKLSSNPQGLNTDTSILLKPRPSLVLNYIGREDILEAMRRTHFTHRLPQLRTPAITVLSGLGGSGKTQIALRFALDFEELYSETPIYFLNADSEESLKRDYENLIRSLGTEHRLKSHNDALTWLATKLKNWLLILDNADNPDLPLFSYIPKSAVGNVIITTRNSNHASIAPNSAHHIEGLSEADSVALILNSSGYESTEANQALATAIVQELGNLPLALAQAAGYIFVGKCLPRYLEMYRKSAVEILASSPSQRSDDYKSSVSTTIQMSLVRLPQEAQDVLSLFAHLDSTSIPHSVIVRAAERQFEHVTWTERSDCDPRTLEQAQVLRETFNNGGEWSDFKFNELIAQCLQYSLLQITTQGEDNFYSMHVLVRSYLRASSALIRGHRPSQLAARLMGSSFTYGANYEYLGFNRVLLPHLRLIQLEDVVEAGDYLAFGHVLYETGDWKLASTYWECCVKIWRESLGVEHENTLKAMTAVSISYNELGRSQEALVLDEQILASRRKMLGPEHSDTLKAIHNLARSYKRVGRKEEAMAMEEQVLKLRIKVLGPENPLTLTTMQSLAISLSGLGRNLEAFKLEEQVLETQRKVLGPEHPDTLRSMYNLAISCKRLRRFQEGMGLEEQVVELRTKVLGLEHPETAMAMWNLSCSLEALGLKKRQLEVTRTAIPVYEAVWGSDDAKTILARKELKELELELEGKGSQ